MCTNNPIGAAWRKIGISFRQVLTLSTQRQTGHFISFIGRGGLRNLQPLKKARAEHAKRPLFIVKYANLSHSYSRLRRVCLINSPRRIKKHVQSVQNYCFSLLNMHISDVLSCCSRRRGFSSSLFYIIPVYNVSDSRFNLFTFFGGEPYIQGWPLDIPFRGIFCNFNLVLYVCSRRGRIAVSFVVEICHWPELLEVCLALTSVDYHRNV